MPGELEGDFCSFFQAIGNVEGARLSTLYLRTICGSQIRRFQQWPTDGTRFRCQAAVADKLKCAGWFYEKLPFTIEHKEAILPDLIPL